MGIHDIIEGKREWRAHQARVRALPKETYAKLMANDKQLAPLKPEIDALRKPGAK